MKVCIIQPAYSTDFADSERYFSEQLKLLDACDRSMDLIVLPEMCDIPCLASTKEDADRASAKFNATLLERVAETARRCNAMVFVNARSAEVGGPRNTTYAFNRRGEIAGKYFKQHLTPGEVTRTRLDSDYSFEFSEPTVIEMEGLRFGFLTCYDFYFYEAFANMARQDLDIVIGCSHQRSDTHLALEIISQNLAYNTNAYVIRSSVSMNEDSDIGGASMVVAPTGEVLLNMRSRVGLGTVEIDPKKKYYKPAGFGNPPAAHYEYIEKGRRPWKYRPAGSAIVRYDAIMPYPRVCAQSGFSRVAPENSLASFGAAVAMGAEEIGLEVQFTKDGEAVSLRDPALDRSTNGTGPVGEYTLAELRTLDFGAKYGDAFHGMTVPTLEDILKKLSCHCIMNIHLETEGDKPEHLERLVALIRRYDCEKYAYITSGQDRILSRLQQEHPELLRCYKAKKGELHPVERAVGHGCKRLWLARGCFDRETVERAHERGMICNAPLSDDVREIQEFLEIGIDVIPTNDYCRVSQLVGKREKYTAY